MQHSNLNGLHLFQEVIRAVTGYDFVLAGGCVRDVLHDKTPKDYDAILCVGSDDYSKAFAMVQEISEVLSMQGFASKCYAAYGVNNTGNRTGAFEETFLACMKTNIAGWDVDLLLSRKPHIADHCIMHDCNLNMVWLDAGKADGYGGVRLPAAKLEFRPGICKERVDYITEKMRGYGYAD